MDTTAMHTTNDDDLPVLDAVVRGGNASIIRALRVGRETLEALEQLRSSALDAIDPATLARATAETDPPGAPVRATHRPGCGDGSPVILDPDTLRPVSTASATSATYIDVVLEREVDALRRELRELLRGELAVPHALSSAGRIHGVDLAIDLGMALANDTDDGHEANDCEDDDDEGDEGDSHDTGAGTAG